MRNFPVVGLYRMRNKKIFTRCGWNEYIVYVIFLSITERIRISLILGLLILMHKMDAFNTPGSLR
ncbi:hypothetical protein IEQ34_007011 [Dendrobium chrysotoxum]|uniref:Uncharacterized protein n=1 Tax=Dendrobium chrysotoxum TaxID=161865 RepID=A0AAV7H9R6_DENCH|nr:hypothetical protein IEQ34_007011 [Dendrobium chrysotoxum]